MATSRKADDGGRQRRGSEDHAGSGARNDRQGNTLVVDVRDAPEVRRAADMPARYMSRAACGISRRSGVALPRQEFRQEQAVFCTAHPGADAPRWAAKVLKDMGLASVQRRRLQDWSKAAARSKSRPDRRVRIPAIDTQYRTADDGTDLPPAMSAGAPSTSAQCRLRVGNARQPDIGQSLPG